MTTSEPVLEPDDAAKLRTLIRQAHEAATDLRAALADARQFTDRLLPAEISKQANDYLREYIRECMEILRVQTDKTIADQAAVIRRDFRALQRTMLGTDIEAVREGRSSIPDAARRLGAARAPAVPIPEAFRRLAP
jgi:class 3 adenylate cyclase